LGKQTKQATTIVDIAKKLGLSAMTVSRALTGNREVSDKTRQRVIRTANALGYQPNRWARSLVTRRSSIIGVVIPDIAHSFFAEITFGIEDVCDKAGYNILLCHSKGDSEREKSEVGMLASSRVDGLIIASVQPENTPEPFARLRQSGVPIVLVDRFFSKAEFTTVRVDDRAVGRLAVECLVELGHRRIAMIQGPAVSPASQRKRGFSEAMKAHGLPVPSEYMVTGDFEIEGGRKATRKLLELPEPPTAVFAANDPMGIGAIYGCRDLGVAVPQQMSVIGAGNIEGPHHPTPFLTTVDWPRVDLGRAAASMLLEAVKGTNPQQPATKVFEPRVLVRQSTARLPQAARQRA
jgi:DNA-binding LacI/PurR family transcriptional regulator